VHVTVNDVAAPIVRYVCCLTLCELAKQVW
jgi:hypothetical protein